MATPNERARVRRKAEEVCAKGTEEIEQLRTQLATNDRALEFTADAYQVLAVSHYVLDNRDKAVDYFVLASHYYRSTYEVITCGPGSEVEMEVPEEGVTLRLAGQAPTRHLSQWSWIQHLALAITLRDLRTIEVLVDFDDFITGIGPNGPSAVYAAGAKRSEKVVAYYRSLMASEPDAVQRLWVHSHTAAPRGLSTDPQNDWYHHYRAAAALVTGASDHFSAAVRHSNAMHKKLYDNGSHSVRGTINWETAALTRIALDNGFPAPEPNRYSPDFFDPADPAPALTQFQDQSVALNLPLPVRSAPPSLEPTWPHYRVVASADLVGQDTNVDYQPVMVASAREMAAELVAHAHLPEAQSLDSTLAQLIADVLSGEITRPVGKKGFPSTRKFDEMGQGLPDLTNALADFQIRVADGGEISQAMRNVLEKMSR